LALLPPTLFFTRIGNLLAVWARSFAVGVGRGGLFSNLNPTTEGGKKESIQN